MWRSIYDQVRRLQRAGRWCEPAGPDYQAAENTGLSILAYQLNRVTIWMIRDVSVPVSPVSW